MTTQKLVEALPCPFCGGNPDIIERPDNIDGTQFFFAVACYCGGYSATAHKMAVRSTPEQAKADAIAAWNTRHLAEQAAEAQPVAFVHWPISGAPRLVWYGNKALEDAIRKACDGHQPDLLLYPRPQQPLSDEQIDHLLPEIVSGGTFTVITYGRAVARATEAAHGIGCNALLYR